MERRSAFRFQKIHTFARWQNCRRERNVDFRRRRRRTTAFLRQVTRGDRGRRPKNAFLPTTAFKPRQLSVAVAAHIAIASILAKKSKQWVDISGGRGWKQWSRLYATVLHPRAISRHNRSSLRSCVRCTYSYIECVCVCVYVNTSIHNIQAIRKLFELLARTTCSQ